MNFTEWFTYFNDKTPFRVAKKILLDYEENYLSAPISESNQIM